MAFAITTAAAAAVATSAYINAKFSLSIDIQNLRYDRQWVARLQSRIKALGDTCTLFAMFDGVEEGKECLWFEGRGWTYGGLKGGEFFLDCFSFWGERRGDR